MLEPHSDKNKARQRGCDSGTAGGVPGGRQLGGSKGIVEVAGGGGGQVCIAVKVLIVS